MDYDRLKETVRLYYRLTELHIEIDKLVANVPCPLSPECFSGTLVAIRLLPGTQKGLTFQRHDVESRLVSVSTASTMDFAKPHGGIVAPQNHT